MCFLFLYVNIHIYIRNMYIFVVHFFIPEFLEIVKSLVT